MPRESLPQVDENEYYWADLIGLKVMNTAAAKFGFSLNYQYFDIGAGYFSNAASRRETDVLLTEGSESSWYGWGKSSTSIWLGGAAKDYQQAPSSAKCNAGGGGVCALEL